jgi:methionyl-tRNA synthetase
MGDKILVASAWPYVNSVPHLGNLIGSILSADVFARYARLKYGKDNVLFVSGSDEHGTPIEVEAKKRGVDPKELTDQAHQYDSLMFSEWEISFDNYTRTESEIHKAFVRDFLLKLNNYVRVQKETLPYCDYDKLFLPDRFVKGTCPYCGFDDARGDQCDSCGRLLQPSSLINPKCALCGRAPSFKETEQWFFDLSSFSERIEEWIKSNEKLPKNVKSMALGWISEGLRPRSLTRDNQWGIRAPFPGAESKTIYVWFEALLGYISATIEYFSKMGSEERWKDFWFHKEARAYFFIGKDNIPFHAVILPAMLMASGEGYNLPHMIAATEYLIYEGQKFSKSRRIGIWIDEAVELMDVEYWRFILLRMRPEERDSNFTWREALRIVNTELNDDVGNYVNRVLTLLKRHFNGEVPAIVEEKLKEEDREMIASLKEHVSEVTRLFEEARLKAASEVIMRLARRSNYYLNARSPWDLVKVDKEQAGNVLHIAVNVMRSLAVMLYPFIPSHAQRLFNMLNLGEVEETPWNSISELALRPGHRIGEFHSLFKKLPQDFENSVEERLSAIREKVNGRRPALLK